MCDRFIQTNRHTDRQTYRQTDIQTDIHRGAPLLKKDLTDSTQVSKIDFTIMQSIKL